MSTAAGTGRETRDFRPRPIVLFALVLVLVICFALFLMRTLFDDLRVQRQRSEPAPVPVAISELPPEPRLQIDPGTDMKALRAEEDQLLNEYEWIDRRQGILRIPIEQAMKRLVDRNHAAEAEREAQ